MRVQLSWLRSRDKKNDILQLATRVSLVMLEKLFPEVNTGVSRLLYQSPTPLVSLGKTAGAVASKRLKRYQQCSQKEGHF